MFKLRSIVLTTFALSRIFTLVFSFHCSSLHRASLPSFSSLSLIPRKNILSFTKRSPSFFFLFSNHQHHYYSSQKKMDSESSSKKEKYYKWILFDADDTLFKFDSFTGLKHMFNKYDFPFHEKDFEEYQVVNHALWADLQKGLITQKELQARRFHVWAERVTAMKRLQDPSYPEISTEELNNNFLDSMAITSTPLDGCLQLLNSLKGRKVKIGIITNGFTRLQEARLHHLGLQDYFDLLVISEKVGLAKPSREIFDHALSLIGDIARHEVLMVGDTLESDILGGNNAEIDTFWLNAHQKTRPENIIPTYEASNLFEIEKQLLSMIDEDEKAM